MSELDDLGTKRTAPPKPEEIERVRQIGLAKEKVEFATQIYISMFMNPKYFDLPDAKKMNKAFDASGLFILSTRKYIKDLDEELRKKVPLIHKV